jgi:hypothetical protein
VHFSRIQPIQKMVRFLKDKAGQTVSKHSRGDSNIGEGNMLACDICKQTLTGADILCDDCRQAIVRLHMICEKQPELLGGGIVEETLNMETASAAAA